MTPHTPGPWRAVGDAMKVYADNMCICDIRGWGHLTGTGGLHLSDEDAVAIQRANTRLIVAAPELLAAAKDAAREWRLHGQLTDSCRVLEAAIAKAEGR